MKKFFWKFVWGDSHWSVPLWGFISLQCGHMAWHIEQFYILEPSERQCDQHPSSASAPETTLGQWSCESLTSRPYIRQLLQGHFSQQLWLHTRYWFCDLSFLPPFHWETDSVSNCAFSGTVNLNSSIVSFSPCMWAPAPICVAKASYHL